jgi:hypothetical protein
MESEPVDFVAVFLGRLFINATPEETKTGLTIPAFKHEGMSMPERFIDNISLSHRGIPAEPGRHCAVFRTREEAEEFINSQTVRRSGWTVIPRVGTGN